MLTPKQIIFLQQAAQKGFACSFPATKWRQEFCSECNIGYIQSKKWYLADKDIPKLESYLREHGYGVEPINEKILNNRISTAGVFAEEKRADAVTSNRLFCLALSQLSLGSAIMPTNRAFDAKLKEVSNSEVSQVLIIENLEVFFEVYRFKQVTDLLNEDCLVVYRGDRCYSAEAIRALTSEFKGETVAFFDFDPAGLSRLGLRGIDKVIVPSIADIERNGIEWNQPHLFSQQINQYQKSVAEIMNMPSNNLSEHAALMIDKRLGVTQERLLAKGAELTLAKLS